MYEHLIIELTYHSKKFHKQIENYDKPVNETKTKDYRSKLTGKLSDNGDKKRREKIIKTLKLKTSKVLTEIDKKSVVTSFADLFDCFIETCIKHDEFVPSIFISLQQ